MVDGDQFPITPYSFGVVAKVNKSGVRKKSQRAFLPLVFSLLADPTDKNAPLKKKTAIVREQNPGENEPLLEISPPKLVLTSFVTFRSPIKKVIRTRKIYHGTFSRGGAVSLFYQFPILPKLTQLQFLQSSPRIVYN